MCLTPSLLRVQARQECGWEPKGLWLLRIPGARQRPLLLLQTLQTRSAEQGALQNGTVKLPVLSASASARACGRIRCVVGRLTHRRVCCRMPKRLRAPSAISTTMISTGGLPLLSVRLRAAERLHADNRECMQAEPAH